MSTAPFTGHADLREALARASADHQLPATLLIHGGPGCGKQSLALWIAQLRLCEAPGPTGGCGSCRSCRFAIRLEHPDIHWYFPLARPKGVSGPERLARALEQSRQERLIELRKSPLRPPPPSEVRGLYLAQVLDIRRAAQKRPAMGAEQVFILGDAEYLVPQEASPEAANALLKLLEEPPPHGRFILTSSRPESLLETIRSRSLEIHLPPLPQAEVQAFLMEHASATAEDATMAAARSGGSVGQALGHLDPDGELATRRSEALNLLSHATQGTRADVYAAAMSFPPARARALLDLLADVQEGIRDLSRVALEAPSGPTDTDLPRLSGGAAMTPDQAAAAVDRVEWARTLAEANVNPQLLMASLLLDLHDNFRGVRPE
ncbi:MAG: hypothetical protein HKN73_06135 [Gemmatimonadetes bacterium]|nr:hypothetical protein [Gemmatimonadota bacterium]